MRRQDDCMPLAHSLQELQELLQPLGAARSVVEFFRRFWRRIFGSKTKATGGE